MREIVKLILAAATILIAGSLIALFASGYISAFRPGGTAEAPGGHAVGGGGTVVSTGGIRGGTSVVGTPSPLPQPSPRALETAQMPGGTQPVAPSMPPGTSQLAPPVPASAAGASAGPALPAVQPSLPPAPPTMIPPQHGEKPVFTWPGFPQLPGQGELLQTTSWLLRIIPSLFPGLYPGWTWWTSGS